MSDESEESTDHPDWEQRYVDDDLPWDTGEPDVHLPEVIEEYEIGSGKALVVGCGTGTNAVWLAEQGFDVTGVDLSETAIGRAEARAGEAGVDCRLVATDFLADSVPDGPFDFAYDRGVFHVFDQADDRARFAARVAERLAGDGMWHSRIGSTDGPARHGATPTQCPRYRLGG